MQRPTFASAGGRVRRLGHDRRASNPARGSVRERAGLLQHLLLARARGNGASNVVGVLQVAGGRWRCGRARHGRREEERGRQRVTRKQALHPCLKPVPLRANHASNLWARQPAIGQTACKTCRFVSRTGLPDRRTSLIVGRRGYRAGRMFQFWPLVERLLRVHGALRREAQEPAAPASTGHGVAAQPPSSGTRVDVVVTVHDALEDVERCLDSLRSHPDGFALRVIVVDDASSAPTRARLLTRAAAWSQLSLIELTENVGYTRAVNTGLSASDAGWVVLLNSDTVVTAGWLERLMRCASSDEAIGIVGPLSNAASWQSVPLVHDASGRFAVNHLPSGLEVEDMARLVACAWNGSYPRVPGLNGFCLLVRRSLIEQIGGMDANAFPIGYGEENDYCLRAADAGFTLAVATDAFVYHAKSKSFGHAARREHSRRGAVALERKHGATRVAALNDSLRDHAELAASRDRIRDAIRVENASQEETCALRVLFLLPAYGISGGASSVIREAAEMLALGASVRVAVPPQRLGDLGADYADVPRVRELLIGPTVDELRELAKEFDVVVGTVYYTMEWVAQMVAASPSTLPAYYVQDYEPFFFEDGSEEARAAQASYRRVPGALLFAKSRWLLDTLRERHGVLAVKVAPGLDSATFRPGRPSGCGRVRVTAMVRPQTPRRAAARTMRVLKALAARMGQTIELHVFGCTPTDPRFAMLERDFSFVAHGSLRRPEVAQLLRATDVFLDLSDYQAFGRASLEAMASGCVAVVPRAGGGDEFARDGENAIVVDTSDETECVERIVRLLASPKDLERLKQAALRTSSEYSLSRAALSELKALAEAARAWRATHAAPQRKQLAFVSLIDDTRPAWRRGMDRAVWQQSAVHESWRSSDVDGFPRPGTAEVVVVFCEPARCNWHSLAGWLAAWRAAGGKAIVHVVSIPVEPQDHVELGLRWLGQAFDAVVVSEVGDASRLQDVGVASQVLALALDPLKWRSGPAGRRLARAVPPRKTLRIGVLAGGHEALELRPLRLATDDVARAYGDAIVVEAVDASIGARLRPPLGTGDDAWMDWAHGKLDWDIALVPSSPCSSDTKARLLASAAFSGVVLVASSCADSLAEEPDLHCRLVEDTSRGWRNALGNFIEDAAARIELRERTAVGLELRQLESDRAQLAATLLHDVLTREAERPVVALPAGLRRAPLAWFTRQPRYAPVTPHDRAPFPRRRSRFRRKLDKLRRDPAAFFRDSKLAPVRLLESLFR
jgi:GT2 family glycosyltransferase